MAKQRTNDDEYIDYSCSTPIERLARDIEALLRSWHVVAGADRHVSFHKSHNTNTSICSTPRTTTMLGTPSIIHRSTAATNTNTNTSPNRIISSTKYNRTPQLGTSSTEKKEPRSPERKKLISSFRRRSSLNFHTSFDDRIATDHSTVNTQNDTQTTAVTKTALLIRSGKVTLTAPLPNSASYKDRFTVDLILCLWDGPPPSPSTSTSSNISQPFNCPPTFNSSKISPQRTHSHTQQNSNTTTTTLETTTSSIPLSLDEHRKSPFPNELLSNLSSLLGIGQHITLSPSQSSYHQAHSFLKCTMDALLHANHADNQHSTFTSTTNTSSSLRSILTPKASLLKQASFSNNHNDNNNNDDCNTTISTPRLDYAKIHHSAQDIVALHSAALQSLSQQLQTALNIATTASDCRIPSFGMWSFYQPDEDGNYNYDSANTTNNDTNTIDNNNTITKNNHHKVKPPTLIQSIMDVPLWLNGFHLFDLASECSPCSTFIKRMEVLHQEKLFKQQNEMEIQLDEKNETTDTSMITKDTTTKISNTLNENQSHKVVHESKKPSITINTNSIITTSTKNTKLSTPSNCTTPTHNNMSKLSQNLYLSPIIQGYCQPGPLLFGRGASFLIHVVPPGVNFPIHCTTLNSLGYLLLQHCSSTKLNTKSPSSSPHSENDSYNLKDPPDNNMIAKYNKVGVIGARHKYTWSKLFQSFGMIRDISSSSLTTSMINNNQNDNYTNFCYLSSNIPWRSSCIHEVIEYEDKCVLHALKMIHHIVHISQVYDNSADEEGRQQQMQPLWGSIDDPILTIDTSVTWGGIGDKASSSTPATQLLTLPLRIRSHNSLSSQDVLEMENALVSTIFNPLAVSPHDFTVHVSYDPEVACMSLSATNRCILAALIRVSTLQPDILLGHLTKTKVLEGLNSQDNLIESTNDLMDKGQVGSITRQLVDSMDWASMGASSPSEASEDKAKWNYIVREILDSHLMRGYPSPPSSYHKNDQDEHSRCFLKASPPGRLLSNLFSSMATLLTPSSMAGLWLEFVNELRIRWENKESLQNLRHVPALDQSIQRDSDLKTANILNSLGRNAKNAAFLHSSEPDPDTNHCLINQKLEVFNIGVEIMTAKEEMSEETYFNALEDDSIVDIGQGIKASTINDGVTRSGARCPVLGVYLSDSGDQLYAPYLQRPSPITDDVINEQRKILDAQENEDGRKNSRRKMSLIQRLQTPKLRSDMSAFKAANPGSKFQDFVNWYGYPEDSDCDSFHNESNRTTKLKEATSFWIDLWKSVTKPSPASEQEPLFDALSTVEMLLSSFESLHPSQLINQVLAVNLVTSNFILNSTTEISRIPIVQQALKKLASMIENALLLLDQDFKQDISIKRSMALKKKENKNGDQSFLSPQTLNRCEIACNFMGDVEVLLSRATSLMSKFSNDHNIVNNILSNRVAHEAKVDSYGGRNGILKSILNQQQTNSGKADEISDLDLPLPSVREYVLRNRDERNPCQLSACIGGTHGLEKGSTNSTRGGLVLALNKSIADT